MRGLQGFLRCAFATLKASKCPKNIPLQAQSESAFHSLARVQESAAKNISLFSTACLRAAKVRTPWSEFARQCSGQQAARSFAVSPAGRSSVWVAKGLLRPSHGGVSGGNSFIAGRRKATLAQEQTVLGALPSQALQVSSIEGLGSGLSREARRSLALWLGGCAAWVFSMVVLGGLTRLTRSGLSMTDWNFTGERPPTNQADWEAEFHRYQQSPEFKRVNRSMSLEEFKFIYWMEYAHRMWGRLLGLVFAVPAAYFAARGYINRPLAKRLGLLFLMGGTQGLVGWWMVRSGLQDPEKEYETPRVSPYRLAAHLGSAFLIYSILLWTSMSLAWPLSPAANPATLATQAVGSAALRRWMLPVAGLIAVTGMSGAFVAGMDAGHAYNTFPLMEGHLIPEEYWAMPGWHNAFENTAAVQFHHRLLAMSTLTAVSATWLAHRQTPLPKTPRLLLHGLVAVTALQVTLGITTLLTYVPPSLGAAHQATALTLFTVALAMLHNLRTTAGPASPALRGVTPAAAAAVLLVGAAVTQLN